MRFFYLLSLSVMIGIGTGCDQPNPREPAEPIGEFPVWGQNFSQESQPADDSRLLGASATPEGPAPTKKTEEIEAKGGSAVPAANPNVGGDWSNGNASSGKMVFINQCAFCHGADGKGGEKPGIGVVPTLRDPAWHGRMTDGKIAKTITHGVGQMPSFMGKLSKDELKNVVAYIRSIKRTESKTPTKAASQPPAQEQPKASTGY